MNEARNLKLRSFSRAVFAINKTQFKDPIHCSIPHQIVEAPKRVLSMLEMGLEWLIILY